MSSRVTALIEVFSRKRLPWRSVAAGLFAACLCGCQAGLPHSTTWERVTSPDYMHPEMTLLHGYHRTTWEEWPEHGFQFHYSESHVVKERPRTKAAEQVPSGPQRQELPKPKAKPSAKTRKPVASSVVSAPQPAAEAEAPRTEAHNAALAAAIAERQRAEDELYAYREAMERELRRREQIAAEEARREAWERPAAIPVEYEAEVATGVPTADEATEAAELIAPPIDEYEAESEISVASVTEDAVEADLLESDAVWAHRFAKLIANDRKQLWSELPEGAATPDFCEPAKDELVAIEQEVETPPAQIEMERTTPRIIGPAPSGKIGEARLQLRAPTDSTAVPPTVCAPQSANGEIRLRVSSSDASELQ